MPATSASTLAPRWHTAAFVAFVIAVAATGAMFGSRGPVAIATSAGAGSRVVAVYLPMLVMQWGLTFYVCRVGRSANVLLELLGARWNGIRRALVDIALAQSAWIFIEMVSFAGDRLLGAGRSAAVAALLPSTATERFAWVLVSISVGFCEEVVYRGYLQTQFASFTGSAGLAVLFQAVLFAVAHGDQGAVHMLPIGVFAMVLGALAYARRSLLPGIICHIGVDLAAGLVGH